MKIAIIGAGAIGGAIANGLIEYGNKSYEIAVSNPSTLPLERLKEKGAKVSHDNTIVCENAEIVILAVKPWIVETVINEVRPVLDYSKQTLVIIAAGIKGSDIENWLRKDGQVPSLMIVMPNTAVAVAKSMTFVVPIKAKNEDISKVTALFDYLGKTMIIDEAHLPIATALASSGIAYAMRYVRAASLGGVELGFKPAESQAILVQTLLGAASLLSIDGAHPETEIDKVTTPGGVTISGLNEMEHAGFTSSVIRGLMASIKKF
jgi:pyrroline-5-carboxylate reductase